MYTHVTDRVAIPAGKGRYNFSPVNAGLAAVKFALEHAFPLDERKASLAHTFFWDVRKFTVPWVHESDQSLGQYLEGYNNVGGFVRRKLTEGYSSYLNSRACLGVVTWTRWAKKGFVEDGVDESKVSVIPPPFEPVFMRAPHVGCNALFIGRDHSRKGGDVVLSAFKGLLDRDTRLTYVGEVDPETKKEMQRDGRITHYERPSNRTLAEEIWPTADIFILPTRTDAFAMTVAEAMSRGVPVVASSIPPISEVVEDGRSGFLAKVGDAAAVRDRIQRLAGDPELRRKMGAYGQERVGTLFSPRKVAGELLEVYRGR